MDGLPGRCVRYVSVKSKSPGRRIIRTKLATCQGGRHPAAGIRVRTAGVQPGTGADLDTVTGFCEKHDHDVNDVTGYACWECSYETISLMIDERKALTAKLAAVADGLQVAQDTYLWLLCSLPMDLRIHSQHVLCSLRDYIAKAINKTAQEVQENFEVQAVTRKAKGE